LKKPWNKNHLQKSTKFYLPNFNQCEKGNGGKLVSTVLMTHLSKLTRRNKKQLLEQWNGDKVGNNKILNFKMKKSLKLFLSY
jgi:hypothetical protein